VLRNWLNLDNGVRRHSIGVLGSTLSIISKGVFGSQTSILDNLELGSSITCTSLARFGSRISVLQGNWVKIFQYSRLQRLGRACLFGMSVFCDARVGLTMYVLDHVVLGSNLSGAVSVCSAQLILEAQCLSENLGDWEAFFQSQAAPQQGWPCLCSAIVALLARCRRSALHDWAVLCQSANRVGLG
jgi:hypothetical protein